MSSRQEMQKAVGDDYDVIVVGAGINGAGIARDAALRGLRVLMLDRDDIAFGTSSRSSKLIHGGLRYLEQYKFGLVMESVTERGLLLRQAPHLIKALPFIFPVYHGGPQPLWLLRLGMLAYDALSGFRSPKLHRVLSPVGCALAEPALRTSGLQGAPRYFDAATDDARLTLATVIDGIAAGVHVLTWTRVCGLCHAQGQVCGVEVEDSIDGSRRVFKAHVVINAAGPWLDEICRLDAPEMPPLLRCTKGIHIVVRKERLPLSNAVVCLHPEDGRVLFAIPWGDRTYCGTTDTDDSGRPEEVRATRADVQYMLAAMANYFPGCQLEEADVLSTWAGLRPLVAPSPAERLSASQVSREHSIVVSSRGLVTVAGGKLTTYRKMAAEVVDKAQGVLRQRGYVAGGKRPPTKKRPLPGRWEGSGDPVVAVVQASQGRMTRDVARGLVEVYGAGATGVAERVARDASLGALLSASPATILAQVDHAVEAELAATLCDFFVRRTQIFFRDVHQGLEALPVVAERMQKICGWDDARRRHEEARYRAEVARSRQWRED